MSNYRTFVVPYDFSAHARAALFTATDLAKRLQADLHLVHVIQPPYAYSYGAYGAGGVPTTFDMGLVRTGAQTSLDAVVGEIQGVPGKIECHVVEGSAIAKAIQDAAEKFGADLIIMGTHGRTGLAHVFLGSVAERTLRNAHCPVLTVQAPKEDEAEE